MSTFLALVNDLERESGTIAQERRLATVVAPFGRQEKIVNWVREAWRMIQVARGDWPWMKDDFQYVLTTGQARYSALDLGITNFAAWSVPVARDDSPFTTWPINTGKRDEVPLRAVGYPEFRNRWLRGLHDPNAPLQYTVDRDLKLCVGPTPDRPHMLTGEYRRTPQILTLDADVPIMPPEHHMTIVWRALMLLGDHDESPATISAANAKYQVSYRALVDASTPEITL